MEDKKFEVQLGSVAIDMFAIVNYDEVKSILGEKLVNPKCENSKDKKELETKLKEYSDIRTPIAKERANANKLGTAKVKEILSQFDEIRDLVDDYKTPLTEAIEAYDEKNRLEKLEKKKAIFLPQIEEANNVIRDINLTYGKALIELIQWDDSFANMKDEKVVFLLEEAIQGAIKRKQEIDNNIEAVEILCESLKGLYNLQSDLNYKLILDDRIYTDSLKDLKERLDKFADQQQKSEAEAADKAEEEANRKAQKEADRVKKEEEAKHQAELKAATEKAIAEERGKIEVEQELEKAKNLVEEIKAIAEKEEIKQEIEQKIEQHNEKPEESIKKYKLEFEITSTEANLMMQYFKDNNIKFEVIR